MGGFGGVTGGDARLTFVFRGSVTAAGRTNFFLSGSIVRIVRILLG
jgi:hypothetical protein